MLTPPSSIIHHVAHRPHSVQIRRIAQLKTFRILAKSSSKDLLTVLNADVSCLHFRLKFIIYQN